MLYPGCLSCAALALHVSGMGCQGVGFELRVKLRLGHTEAIQAKHLAGEDRNELSN